MMARPDFDAMSLPELAAWDAVLRLAIAALTQARGSDAAILADDEAVSVTVSIPIKPRTGDAG